MFFLSLTKTDFLMFSLFGGFFVDLSFILYVLLMLKSLRGWKFDEMEVKSEATEKPNSCPL